MNNWKPRDTTLEALTDIPLDQIPIKDNIPHKNLLKFKDSASDFIRSRNLWGSSKNSNSDPYSNHAVEAPPEGYYDAYAQGWRMIGGFISCSEFSPNHSSSDRRELNSGDGNDNCARWVLWAAYINPNYAGGEAQEYGLSGERRLSSEDESYGDGEYSYQSKLDCYNQNSSWQLLGIYRIDIDNFLEQMGKHIWASNTYEYITVYSAADYINGGKCKGTGEYDSSGNAVYAALGFTGSGGGFEMKLYSDEKCIYEANDSDFSYDDLGWTSNFDMGSGDDNYYGNDDTTQAYWYSAQESSLKNLNGILDEMRGCMLCLDYPSYQDGELNGDGYDEGDLINQCWKFWSHSAYACDGDCLALAHAQGTISSITYAGSIFGGYYKSSSTSGSSSSRTSSVASTLFICASSIVFIATSLSYFVSRGGKRRSRSSKSQSLLDDNASLRSSRSLRSKESMGGGDKKKRRSREKVENPPVSNESEYHEYRERSKNDFDNEAQLEYQLSKEERRRIRRERRKARER